MVIKRSVAQETQALVAELDVDDEVRREAAIARLAVIGARAVDRIVAMLAGPAVRERTQVAALRALESIGDVRALAPASALLASPHPDVAAAAVAVLRRFLHSRHDTDVLDRLVAVALSPERPDAGRLAALEALGEVGGPVVAPVWLRLRDDPSLAVRQRAAKATGPVDPLDELEAAAAGVLPDDGDAVSALVGRTATVAPLATLHRLIAVIKARETSAPSVAAKNAWVAARGAVHLALAGRDSRVALYDLRETLAVTGPLPAGFVVALQAIGDAASLEAIAAAYARAGTPADADWLQQLTTAFRAIAARERVGPRSAAMKRIAAKWPEAAAALVEKRTRRR